MPAPHDSPAAAGSEKPAMPAFRSYISVELPFAVTPTVTTSSAMLGGADHPSTSAHAGERREVEAFLPASFVVPCLHRATPQQTASRGDAGAAHDSAEEPEGDDEGDDDVPSSSSGGDSDESASRAFPPTVAKRTAVQTARGVRGQRTALRLLTRHHRHYCTVPIFSGWRSTNWGSGSDEEDEEDRASGTGVGGDGCADAHDAAAAAHLQAQKRRRREVFASTEPQLLVNGYYRNDLLLRVRQRRHIRRYRDPVTNAVLREEVDSAEEGQGGSAHGDKDARGTARTSDLSAEVVGVVSREMELARPADFTFALFTPEQLQAAPSLCGADVFPPQHFLSARAPFEVRYEPGRDPNTARRQARGDANGGSAAAQYDFATLPTISISAEESAVLPTRQAAHNSFLRSMGSSLDGGLDTDPPEVQMMVRLLAERPSWVVQDLQDAMLQSGLCPRAYRNKQVMQCFTYLIRNGPFNRLRLRLGYDPYASASSVMYERITVRLLRRSDVGVRLRDVSRSPHIESVLRLLLERDRVRRVEYKSLPGHARRQTLLEMQCRNIRRGQLYVPFQLADVMDDPYMADVVRCVEPATAPMELARRGQRRGWLSEAAYSRAMAHYSEALAALLEEEVEPRLRKLQGEEDAEANATNADKAAESSTSSSKDEELEDDEDEDDSAMFSVSAGDLSEAADDDE
ncbi:RNA polymerase III transcription factor (TF)IIIC subunit family protein [Leishmania donovani]|uniref:RNA polymerase III transcription factor (TF)IIIC subunit family protein n=1 Tax=Leishmania donovani TaxID=5661 RepID=A0A504Y1V4_LEIDO|nr:RNA polymerase III transcription factor (TF)IIIC subunit family protein [Leishmania donovani]